MKRSWLYTLVAVLLLAAGVGAYSLGRIIGNNEANTSLSGTALQTPVNLSDVQLQTGEGDFQFSDLEGKVVVVFFGFVGCPDICPLTMSRLAEIYRNLDEPEDLAVVMVTVDPENDTPELVNNYATGFHPKFMGLGGDNSQVAEAAKRFFIGYNATGGGVVHTDPVLILDRNGAMQRVYSQTNLSKLQNDLPRLLETL